MTSSRYLAGVSMAFALAALGPVRAQAVAGDGFARPAAIGSGAFCLFALPAEPNGSQRWINLGIVQFVEASGREVRIAYGGGNLGAGHEARIPVVHADDAVAYVERMRQRAADCR